MIDWVLGQPFWIAVAFLTGVAAVRAQSTYWLGRGIRAGLVRAAWAKNLATKNEGAVRQLEKWGWPLIPVSFLTIGFQTAVQLTAGLVGWRWARYTLASVPGWLLWGFVYAAGALGVFVGLVELASRAWWLAALAVLVVVGVVFLIVRLRRRARAARDPEPLDAS